jgi:hypothetical protein
MQPYGDEHTPHRMTIGARCPMGATPGMRAKYQDFLYALDGSRQPDQDEEDRDGKASDSVCEACQ